MGTPEEPGMNAGDRTISRLIFAAGTVVLFTLGAGALLQNRIDRLIAARDWTEHSLEVQANLQALVIRLDRYDSLLNLYLVDHMPGRLREARNLGIAIESSSRQIANLVADNRAQDEHVVRLNQCAATLAQTVRILDSPTVSFPTGARGLLP